MFCFFEVGNTFSWGVTFLVYRVSSWTPSFNICTPVLSQCLFGGSRWWFSLVTLNPILKQVQSLDMSAKQIGSTNLNHQSRFDYLQVISAKSTTPYSMDQPSSWANGCYLQTISTFVWLGCLKRLKHPFNGALDYDAPDSLSINFQKQPLKLLYVTFVGFRSYDSLPYYVYIYIYYLFTVYIYRNFHLRTGPFLMTSIVHNGETSFLLRSFWW